ncbi:winged helix-turn-helix transcriptional regulator [Methanoregula sp.]|uniref:winged helix-turn-helix transcriptional regulator n=1 Tax=Methanoregula sp. TaxID=2052170 RepID=UPI0026380493|nr:winged helix-turn-helix transcriptional regulator [Methanoregula sp.]MDD5142362.1 winged helix-turn-helix transcriptional regulator [Methanoregula sp.]
MYTRGILSILIGIILIAVLVVPSHADNTGGYTVSPVPPGMNPGISFETKEVSFWELPLQVIILSLALSVSPLLELMTQLFLFTKFYLYLGYRKIARKNILQNDTREKIYQCIRENPGIFFNAITRKTGIRPGTLRYHLIMLHTENKVSILASEGHARYFENSDHFSDAEKNILKFIQNKKDCQILTQLMKTPELNRKELGNKLGISGLMITWYTKRLNDAGLISLEKVGKKARYEISPEVRNYLEKYLISKSDIMQPGIADHSSDSI